MNVPAPRPASVPERRAFLWIRGGVMKVWIKLMGCMDYYCDYMHIAGVYATREAAEAAPVPDEIDDTRPDQFTAPTIGEYEVQGS